MPTDNIATSRSVAAWPERKSDGNLEAHGLRTVTGGGQRPAERAVAYATSPHSTGVHCLEALDLHAAGGSNCCYSVSGSYRGRLKPAPNI
jgi:hypothetical protein